MLQPLLLCPTSHLADLPPERLWLREAVTRAPLGIPSSWPSPRPPPTATLDQEQGVGEET